MLLCGSGKEEAGKDMKQEMAREFIKVLMVVTRFHASAKTMVKFGI